MVLPPLPLFSRRHTKEYVSMANTKRKLLQRKCYQALNDGERFLGKVHHLRNQFAPDHPEFLPLLDAIAQMVIMSQVVLGDFFLAAWGRKPPQFPGHSGPPVEE